MRARALFAALLFAVSCACFAQGAASVVFASGNAQIMGADGKSRSAMRGGELVVGETVDTGGGRVQLRFFDGAEMSLQPATRFRVDEFRFALQDGEARAGDKGVFSLLKGGFRTITGLLGKGRPEQYKVDAVVATIGIRGTDYGAKLDEAGLELSTFQGLVELCNDAGCALVPAGQVFVVTDRNSLPARLGGVTGGGEMIPMMPTLPPPRPMELPDSPPLAPPPNVTPSAPGPSMTQPAGPYQSPGMAPYGQNR